MKIACDPICLYSSVEPSEIELASDPVCVRHGDGELHWEFLVTEAVFLTLSEDNKKTFTKIKGDNDLKKWLKNDELPRHVFGPGGGVRDPDFEYPEMEAA